MSAAPLTVLIIEDNTADARLLEELLVEARVSSIKLVHRDSLSAGLEVLAEGKVDLVLLDLNLGASQGLETLQAVREATSIPIVVLTGFDDVDLARKAVQSGAQDYLVKGEVTPEQLVRSVVYAYERHQIVKSLRDSEAQLRLLTQQVPAILWTTDQHLRFTSSVGKGLEDLKLKQNEMRGRTLQEFFHTEDLSFRPIAMHIDALDGKESSSLVEWQQHWFHTHVEPLKDVNDHVVGTVGVALDVTEQRRMEHDIQAAQRIQRRLLPKSAPNRQGFDIAGACFPAEQCSGDYYDFVPLPDEHLAIIIADAVGHGFGPAILAAMVRCYLRAAAMKHRDVHEMLTLVNWLVIGDWEQDQYITMFCCHLDPENKSFTYASAGHQGYLIDKNDKASVLDSGSLPLRVDEAETFNLSRKFSLRAGDILVLLTDGILEAASEEDEVFGIRRALKAVADHRELPAQEIIQRLYDSVRQFSCNQTLLDDVTAVIVKVDGDEDDTVRLSTNASH